MVAVIISSWSFKRSFVVVDSASAEIGNLSASLLIVGPHDQTVASHDFFLIDLDWNLLNPFGWSEFEGESSNPHGESTNYAFPVLLSSDFGCLEQEEEPLACGPLDEEDEKEDDDEDPAVERFLEDVVLVSSKHTAVDQVEGIEEHEGGEDHSHVSLLVCNHIQFLARVGSASVNLGALGEGGLGVLLVVEAIHSSAEPDDEEHDHNHPDCNSINLAPDSLGHNLDVSGDSRLADDGGKRWCGGEGHSSKSVHDEVDPDELGCTEG